MPFQFIRYVYILRCSFFVLVTYYQFTYRSIPVLVGSLYLLRWSGLIRSAVAFSSVTLLGWLDPFALPRPHCGLVYRSVLFFFGFWLPFAVRSAVLVVGCGCVCWLRWLRCGCWLVPAFVPFTFPVWLPVPMPSPPFVTRSLRTFHHTVTFRVRCRIPRYTHFITTARLRLPLRVPLHCRFTLYAVNVCHLLPRSRVPRLRCRYVVGWLLHILVAVRSWRSPPFVWLHALPVPCIPLLLRRFTLPFRTPPGCGYAHVPVPTVPFTFVCSLIYPILPLPPRVIYVRFYAVCCRWLRLRSGYTAY